MAHEISTALLIWASFAEWQRMKEIFFVDEDINELLLRILGILRLFIGFISVDEKRGEQIEVIDALAIDASFSESSAVGLVLTRVNIGVRAEEQLSIGVIDGSAIFKVEVL